MFTKEPYLEHVGPRRIESIEFTKTNHVIEIQQNLGIEAARKSIIDEIQFIMSNHGMSIDICHMMLLADCMTSGFGIQKMDRSVLMLASFEKTAASASGKVDKIEGVSECIIMGVPMQFGTEILKVMQKNVPDPIFA